MDAPRSDAPKDQAALREWLVQLDRRVAELEQAERQARRRRQRSLWLFAIVGVLYLLLFTYLTSYLPG